MRKLLEGSCVEEGAEGRMIVAALPSSSRAPGEQLEEEHSPDDKSPERDDEAPPSKRARISRGKRPIAETSADAPKVNITEDGHTATVDMTKEWFPSKSVPEGIASSMASILYSRNLEKQMLGLSLSQLRDRASRHQAAAWVMSEFIGDELQITRNLEQKLKSQVNSLKIENSRLSRKNEDWKQRFQEAGDEHDEIIQSLNAAHANALREAEERIADEVSRQYQKELEDLRAQNRRLKEKNADLEGSALRENRGGIELCLDCLYKHNILTDPKWHSLEAIEELISDESDGASTNA